jgi:membrane protease YdiL (CAAX protease family)
MRTLAKRQPLLFSSLVLLLQFLLFGVRCWGLGHWAKVLHKRLWYTMGINNLIMGYGTDRIAGVVVESVIPISISLIAALLVTKLGWWEKVGISPISEWCNLRLYVIPFLITCLILLPLVGPLSILEIPRIFVPGLSILWLFLLYLPIGFEEEIFNRGLIQTALSRYGTTIAICVSAVLFGVMHLGRLIVENQIIVGTLLQVFRAMAVGFGASVLRTRTRTIVPLIMLHGISNWFDGIVWSTVRSWVQFSSLDSVWIAQIPAVIQFVIYELPYYLIGLYGLYLLRQISKQSQLRDEQPSDII